VVEHSLHKEESLYMDLVVLQGLKTQVHSSATLAMGKVIPQHQGQTAIKEIHQTVKGQVVEFQI
jgi:hypothetical protein